MSENMFSPEQGIPNQEQLETSENQRYKKEKERWKEVLGVEVDVPPLPEYVTPEVEKKLNNLGFEVVYMPRLDIGNLDHLKSVGAENYLKELQEKYPKWKTLDSISMDERKDTAIAHNLDLWYWQETQKGNIDFPVLPGQWMAVETVEKPEYQPVPDEILRPENIYAFNPNKILEFQRKTGYQDTQFFSGRDRRGMTCYAVEETLTKSKDKIFNELGLTGKPNDLRLLEALEWNLAENRFGWKRTHMSELTNTKFRTVGFNKDVVDSNYVTVGDSNRTYIENFADLGYTQYRYPGFFNMGGMESGTIGWRAAITLPK